MSAPQPIASGDLVRTPLANLVLSLSQRSLSGTLALWPENQGVRGQDRVLFVEGAVQAAVLLEGAAALERALLPLFHRSGAPWAFYAEDLVGNHPRALRAELDTFALITAAVRTGARSDLIDGLLSRWGEERVRIKRGAPLGRFGFVAKERAFIDVLLAEPQSVSQFLRSAPEQRVPRRLLYVLSLTKQLETFVEERPRPNAPRAGHAVSKASSSGSFELPVPSDLPGLPGLSSAPPPPASRPAPASSRPRSPIPPAMPTARISSLPPGRISSRPPGRPSSRPPGRSPSIDPPPPVPAHLARELLDRWQLIRDYAIAIDNMTYYQMLEVDVGASPDAIRDAYFAKVKQWHPDRLAPELQELKPFVETVFHLLTAASETLGDTENRSAYLKNVQSGGGTPASDRRVARVLEAAMEFQKVEFHLKRKKYAEGLAKVDELLEVVPEEPDFHAMKGLLLFRANAAQTQADADEALAALDAALALHETHERALLTKAQVLQKRDEHEKAFSLFRRIVELNPKNSDAERQVRLYVMRGGAGGPTANAKKTSEKKEGGGFLDKLFGKKK